jgi:hypothetical protein
MKGTRQARWAGALLAIGLLTAACSSGTSGPGGAAASSPAASGSAPPSPSSSASGMAEGIAYAQCMRSHGMPDFPDPRAAPNGQGVGWQLGRGINMTSPQFQAATKACGPMPNLGGGASAPPLTAAQKQQYLKWAACIRAHGVPGFKDPTFRDGYPQITNTGNGAQVQAAEQACASYLRGIPGGGGTITG